MNHDKPSIWVLGNGQLGAMMRYAAMPLGLNVHPVDIMAPATGILPLKTTDIVTAEREQWPESSLSKQLSEHPNFINASVFSRLADRFSQKQLLDELKIPTAPWILLTDDIQAPLLYQKLGKKILLKQRTGGYDGKGQYWLKQVEQTDIPDDWRNKAIAEQAINFDEEVSLIGARTYDGKCHFYPLTLNLHQNGILMASIAPLTRLNSLQTQAENMLRSIMDKLEYIGVMAMESFRVGERLLVNELAPRVHNSGHWTLSGCHISQFELHLRALCQLPIPELKTAQPSMMINLIGIQQDNNWLSLPNAEVYWYNKTVHPGRKVGHLNLDLSDHHETRTSLIKLKNWLPIQYKIPLDWLNAGLKS